MGCCILEDYPEISQFMTRNHLSEAAVPDFSTLLWVDTLYDTLES